MKIFNQWETTGIVITDMALKPYITLKACIIPKTQGRNAYKQFYKNKYHIIERIMNRLMVPGHKGKKHFITSGECGGKAITSYKLMKKTLEIIEKKTQKNPIQVTVTAIENAAPRDEITVIEYGGARYPQAVDVSPLRRVNLALKHIVHGSSDKAFNKKKTISQGLAEEIMMAAEGNGESFALRKKNEAEKQADSAR